MNIDFLCQIRRRAFAASLVLLTLLSGSVAYSQTNGSPSFEAVYKLLQENAVGLSKEELNAAAVRGLLAELEGRVALVTGADSEAGSATNILSRTNLFDGAYAYFKVGRVEEGLSGAITEAYKQLSATNKIKGVVLDVRFADGGDYAAAAKAADLFVSSEQPLIDWGSGSLKASPNTTIANVPSAILVNSRTRGAAEALAAALRETRAGLLIGGTTAGQASIFKEFPLGPGQTLRIASAPVKVGQNKTLDETGLTPDIQLNISLEDERAYLQDPYRVISRPISPVSLSLSTNELTAADSDRLRPRINEAELVRRKREGLSIEDELPEIGTVAKEVRVVRDPSLARALDLLKGLAVIQATRGF